MGDDRWLHEYFDDVDNRRLEPFVARHTKNVTMRFGNAPPMNGQGELRAGISAFWNQIEGLRHRFLNVWEVEPGTTVFEHSIDYTRRDGGVVNVPCTVIFRREGELVAEIRSYIDLTPVLM